MDKKNIIIIAGLAVALIASIGMFMVTNNEKVAVEREREKLRADNESLMQQLNATRDESRRLAGQIDTLKSSLSRAETDKRELERRIELVMKEREEAIEKLKKQQKSAAPVVEQRPSYTQQQSFAAGDEAYWAGILKAKRDLEFQLDSVRQELKAAQINNEQVYRDKNTLELEIKNNQREKEELVRKLEYNQKIMDSIAQELVREKNDKFELQRNLKTVKSENSLLRRQLQTLNNRKMDLERKFSSLQQQDTQLKEKLGGMDMLLKEKILEMDSFKKQFEGVAAAGEVPKVTVENDSKDYVELAPIVVRPQQESTATQTTTATATTTAVMASGSVLALNKENNFVIVDIGENAGLRVSDGLRVYRGERAIADLEVIQLRKEIAACDIKKELEPIAVGDAVR